MSCFTPFFYTIQCNFFSTPITVTIEENCTFFSHTYYPFWWNEQNINEYREKTRDYSYQYIDTIDHNDEKVETF